MLALVAALVAPAAAQAACAATPLAEQAAKAPVIVTATALPGATARGGVGLLSPARFRVVRYDKGSGPGTIDVATALSKNADGTLAIGSEAINPLAGQRWMLWGSFAPSGVFTTSTCLGSQRTVTGAALPQLRTSADRVVASLRRATYDPATTPGKAIAIGKSRPLTLLTGVGSPVDYRQQNLLLSVGLRAKVAGVWQALDVAWHAGPAGQIAAQIKRLPARTTALLLLTANGFFASNVRAG